MRPRSSIRSILSRALLLTTLTVLGLSATVYLGLEVYQVASNQVGRVERQASAVATRYREVRPAPEQVEEWLAGYLLDDAIGTIAIHGVDGELIAVAGDGGGPDLGPLTARTSQPILADGDQLGTVHVVSGSRPLLRVITLDLLVLAVVGGLSILVTLIVSRRVHLGISNQILHLAHAANAIVAKGDFAIRAVSVREEELEILVDTFNNMLARIQERDQQLQDEIERAEAARVAKAQFLATMSHEIRTPISGIVGMTQLLQDTALGQEQNEFVSTIYTSAEGLLAIINDILDFSKAEAGRMEFESIPFSVHQLVEDALGTVAVSASRKELDLVSYVDDQVPAGLRGDPTRLRQVLLNLLSNAIKFTDEGEVTLSVTVDKAHARRPRMRFEVRDTGIGIPPERLDRLFRSFSQVDASDSRRYGGTGLGLAISKQIVEAMGGEVFVNTKEGEGSVFGLRIELLADAEVQEATTHAPPEGLSILLVERSEGSRRSLQSLLRGNRIKAVGDVPSAVEEIQRSRAAGRDFDLFLVDARSVDELTHRAFGRGWKIPPTVLLTTIEQLVDTSPPPGLERWIRLSRPISRGNLYWCLSELLGGGDEQLPEPGIYDDDDYGTPLRFGGRRILVAEDNPVNQRIATLFLKKLGVECEVTGDGEDAVHAFKSSTFDLILMDLQMPRMDGIEATRRIRALEEGANRRTPIVALTASILDEHREQSSEAGFDDYLTKPVKLEMLRECLVRWLEDPPEPPFGSAEEKSPELSRLLQLREGAGLTGVR